MRSHRSEGGGDGSWNEKNRTMNEVRGDEMTCEKEDQSDEMSEIMDERMGYQRKW
jgi:hypothetical protein